MINSYKKYMKIILLLAFFVPLKVFANEECEQVEEVLKEIKKTIKDNPGDEDLVKITVFDDSFASLWNETIDKHPKKFYSIRSLSPDDVEYIVCMSKLLRRDGIKFEIGVLGERFEIPENKQAQTIDNDYENNLHFFTSALFPALYVKNTETSNLGFWTLQAEFESALLSDEQGFIYKKNEVLGDIGFYLPIGEDNQYYNPYVLPDRSISFNLESVLADSDDTSHTLSFNYQIHNKYSGIHNLILQSGVGYSFDEPSDGIKIYSDLEYRHITNNPQTDRINEFIPRINYSYFDPESNNSDQSEYNSKITAQFAWRHKIPKSPTKGMIFELSIGKSWELNDDLDEDSLFGLASISYEFSNPQNLGSGSGGRSRGRRVRP